jgi:non-homologous end joining protein Ku
LERPHSAVAAEHRQVREIEEAQQGAKVIDLMEVLRRSVGSKGENKTKGAAKSARRRKTGGRAKSARRPRSGGRRKAA